MTREALTLGRAISLWERSLAASRKAPRTIKGYVRACEYLETELGRDVDPSSVTIEDLEGILAKWQARSPTTVHNRMVAWREFYAWGQRRYGWQNPTVLLNLPRKDEPEFRRLNTTEVEAMISASSDDRVRLSVLILARLGLRRSELMALRWMHVDLVNATMTVDHATAKGRKGRTIPLPRDLVDLLARTMDQRGDQNTRPNLFVIPYRRGGQWQTEAERTDYTRGISDNSVDFLVKKAAKAARIANDASVTSHMFRRHLAEVLLDQGTSPYVVAALLGHASIRTTQQYGGGASLRAVREALSTMPSAVVRDEIEPDVPGELMELSGFEPLTKPESGVKPSGDEPPPSDSGVDRGAS